MESKAPSILLGIDAGGTKTECVAYSLASRQLHRLLGAPSNYQSIGIQKASEVWRELIDTALSQLGADSAEILAAGLGIAGLDRPLDESRIRPAFAELLNHRPMELVNDAYLALRAGTEDGVGVAVVSGTGCNAMGMNRDGIRFRVGGLGPEFGDLGSANDIGVEAMKRSFRSLDGRGPATVLSSMITESFHLQRLDDIVEAFLHDNRPQQGDSDEFTPGILAPLVFAAAVGGDDEAQSILRWAGYELGLSALAVARHLFTPNEAFPLILGGSVLQKGGAPHLRETLLDEVRCEFPAVEPHVLTVRPVVGALRYALDLAFKLGDVDPGLRTRKMLMDEMDAVADAELE